MDLVEHFGDRPDELSNHISVSLFIDIVEFFVGRNKPQSDDHLFIIVRVLVEFGAEHIVVILSVFVQEVEQFVYLG